MGISGTVVVFRKRKKEYGPVGDSLIRASEDGEFDIRFMKDRLYGYKNVIYFDNDIRRINKNIRAREEANIAWWMGDGRDIYRLPEHFIHEDVKFIFLSVREFIGQYKDTFNIPVFYMPLCGLSFFMKKDREIMWDVLFIGNNYGKYNWHRERNEYLRELKKFNFKQISGEGTTKDMKYLYYHTPINISISRSIDCLTSNRLFNILASGGFALVKYFPGIEDLFENHYDLVWFNDKQEMVDLVKYYLDNPQEREEIAKRGFETYINNHTAQHRIKNMIEIMEGKEDGFKGYRS